jgi:hypothetical protein
MQANTEATLTFACTPRSTASPQPVYFKLVDGSSCDAMGRSDAEYNAALQAPLTFIDQPGTMGVLDGVLTATISTPSNTLIVCYYMGTSPETGSYERLGSATFVVLPATVVTGLSNQSSPLTLIVGRPAQARFSTTDMFPAASSRPYVKIVANGTTCGSGVANALGGLAGQLEYLTPLDGVLTLTLLEDQIAISNPVGCFRIGDASGVYTEIGVLAVSGARFELLHAWEMRQVGGGSTIVDSTGGSTLTLHNTYTHGSHGVRFSLDGYASLDLGKAAQTYGGAMSIEIMVEFTDAMAGGVWLFDFGDAEKDRIGVEINEDKTGAYTLTFSITDSSARYEMTTGPWFEIGHRHHIVCTVIGSTMQIYHGGLLVATRKGAGEPEAVIRSQWLLAKSSVIAAQAANTMHGVISNLKIYNGVLDSGAVVAAFESGNPDTLTQIGCVKDDQTLSRTCRVEGGESLVILATGLGTILTTPSPTPRVDVSVGGLSATSCTVGTLAGRLAILCTMPCLVAFGRSFAVEMTADTATMTAAPWRSGLYVTSATSYQLVPQLQYTCKDAPTIVTVAPATAVPGTDITVVGTNFGPGEPPAWILATTALFFGVDDCASLIKTNSWSSTSLSVKMCAVDGTTLPMSIQIGSAASPASSATFTVIVNPNTPASFSLSKLPNSVDGTMSDVTMQWSDPSSGCPTHYQIWCVLKWSHSPCQIWTCDPVLTPYRCLPRRAVPMLRYTLSPEGLDYAASTITKTELVPACNATGAVQSYAFTIPSALPLGAIVNTKVCAGTASFCGDAAHALAAAAYWTNARVIQVAGAPLAPTIQSLIFLSATPQSGAQRADLLLRLAADFNGGTPSTGGITLTISGQSAVVGSAVVAGSDAASQLAVIEGVNVGTLHDFTVVIRSTIQDGLAGASTTQTSAPSAVRSARFRTLQAPVMATASFGNAQTGTGVYSAGVSWALAAEELGNAPLSSSVVNVRSLFCSLRVHASSSPPPVERAPQISSLRLVSSINSRSNTDTRRPPSRIALWLARV